MRDVSAGSNWAGPATALSVFSWKGAGCWALPWLAQRAYTPGHPQGKASTSRFPPVRLVFQFAP